MSSNVVLRFLMSLMQQLMETSDFLSSSGLVGPSCRKLLKRAVLLCGASSDMAWIKMLTQTSKPAAAIGGRSGTFHVIEAEAFMYSEC